MLKTGMTKSVVSDVIKIITCRSPVQKIILYGSRARGDFKPVSDIDLAVDAPQWSAVDLAVVKDELEDRVATLLKFDLVLMARIDKKSLKDNILKEGIVIYESATR